MTEGWAREEVEALIADYFDMLNHELQGLPYNKTAHRVALAPLLHNRSHGSIEFKHQNVSAILIELGFPYLDGYKPRYNYQRRLREVVVDRLGESPALVLHVESDVTTLPAHLITDTLTLVPPPSATAVRSSTSPEDSYRTTPEPRFTNYLQLEAQNRSLGALGEELVVRFEQDRLSLAGHDRLASRVEQVSVTRGDGLGFDILSFDVNGRERFLEVKTTKYGAETPFFVSRNEARVSARHDSQYHLYRVYGMRKGAKLFTLAGDLNKSCALEPESYVARVA